VTHEVQPSEPDDCRRDCPRPLVGHVAGRVFSRPRVKAELPRHHCGRPEIHFTAQIFITRPKSAQEVNYEIQVQPEPAMNEKPKHRWYQFSLKTLVLAPAFVGIVLGTFLPWRVHRQFCLNRAEFHRSKILDYQGERVEFVSGGLNGGTDEEILAILSSQMKAKRERLKQQDDSHKALASAYEHAIWLPWERIWIDDSLPPDERPQPLTSQGFLTTPP
jgi:hypothetical protein